MSDAPFAAISILLGVVVMFLIPVHCGALDKIQKWQAVERCLNAGNELEECKTVVGLE